MASKRTIRGQGENLLISAICAALGLLLAAAGAMWASFRICLYFGLHGQSLRMLVSIGVFLFAAGLWCRGFSNFRNRKTLGWAMALIGIGFAAAAVILHLA